MQENSENKENLISNDNSQQKEGAVNNNDILEKQNLIKENILDKHFDKNLFFSYCMKFKPENGDDLKYWSKEELTIVINNFVEEQNKYYINAQKVMNQNIQMNTPQAPEKKNAPQNVIEVPCGKLDKTILNDKEIKSEIKNPRTIDGGFFSNAYILYDIETIIDINTKWIVQRRYSDFIWLRESLTKSFPREMIPPPTRKENRGKEV